MINGMGIEVHEVAPDAETLLLAGDSRQRPRVDDTAAEEAAAALTALDGEGGRTTDPVRMYMREMGTVELLTREGEIAIAKRIEEGLNQVQAALAAFPGTIAQICSTITNQHKAGKKRLAEIVVGFLDAETRRPKPVPVVVAEADADAEDEDDEVDGDDDEAAEERPDRSGSGRSRATAWARCADALRQVREGLRASTARPHKTVLKVREEMARSLRHPQAAAGADRHAGAQAARGA